MQAHARTTDPITSHIAADDVTPHLGKQQISVLAALKANDGITAKALGEIMAKDSIRKVSWPHKRMVELELLGYVFRQWVFTDKEMTCFITDKGKDILKCQHQ